MPLTEKEAHLRELFPNLTEQEFVEVRDLLHSYCEILLRIFTRLEQERRQDFDDNLPGS
jgi:hypothetical protein